MGWRNAFAALLLGAAIATITPGGATAVGTLDRIEDRLLAAHNLERAQLAVRPLRWNRTLAADAQHWARRLADANMLAHAPDTRRQGENLWAGSSGVYTPEDMVGLWAAERDNFQPGIFPANSRTGDLADVGHYTQMIWAGTREVGCAIARGDYADFLVCRYSNGGNVVGESPI